MSEKVTGTPIGGRSPRPFGRGGLSPLPVVGEIFYEGEIPLCLRHCSPTELRRPAALAGLDRPAPAIDLKQTTGFLSGCHHPDCEVVVHDFLSVRLAGLHCLTYMTIVLSLEGVKGLEQKVIQRCYAQVWIKLWINLSTYCG